MFQFTVETSRSFERIWYQADWITLEGDNVFQMVLPWENYGAFCRLQCPTGESRIKLTGNWSQVHADEENKRVICQSGPYTIVFQYEGLAKAETAGDEVIFLADQTLTLGMAFHIETEKAVTEAKQLAEHWDDCQKKSREFWEAYFASCPVAEFPKGYRCEKQNKEEFYTKEQILCRQYWLWWGALINLSHLPFNKREIYMAPDKTNWTGTWSNDGPETLAALSLTNAAPLVRECYLAYVEDSLSEDGDLSWYTWYDGEGCRNIKGDVGQYSHGVPTFVHTADFYIRNTGDTGILNERLKGERTLWEVLCSYIHRVFEVRDINGDGLIEWNHLWETGWDDKIGPFFRDADLDTWMQAAVTESEEYQSFHKQHSNPVTSMVEQVYFLWALRSMISMSRIQKDEKTEQFCKNHYLQMKKQIHDRHWNPDSGFYHDWDVKENVLSETKNADAFYYLYFEKESDRQESMMKIYRDEQEFGSLYCPMSSRKNQGFSEYGYWSGGHWPREMGYLGMAFYEAGYEEEAIQVIIRSICCKEGNILPEVLNPLTGELTTRITKMAYDVLNNVALLHCTGKYNWSEEV